MNMNRAGKVKTFQQNSDILKNHCGMAQES